MKGWWWKGLSVVLLLYVVIVGLRTPLGPALVHVSVERIAPGEVSFEVTGYNTHFKENAPHLWLENDGQKVCATSVTPISDAAVSVTFTVPQGLRESMTSIRAWDVKDGPLVLHEAFFTEGRGTGITETPCAIQETARTSFAFPNRAILNETIRNLFFHVPMWFTMMVLMTISFWQSLRVLRTGDLGADRMALSAVDVSLLFAALGLITGSIWARATWGNWWTSDPKLNGAAVTVLIYAAYLILRGSIPDGHKRARLAAIYNIFAYVLMFVFIMVLPRLTDSLHPGNGGNPAFSSYDLDSSLRALFYPAVIGWILLGVWAYTLHLRVSRLKALSDDASD
ncbi:MAG: cytochrome c biogenesis protein [Flavobacteriales bacterium]|jgi:heme exporter protein C|nr:cytochrome c biogenesis protein [Flavobacteriales bacterium]